MSWIVDELLNSFTLVRNARVYAAIGEEHNRNRRTAEWEAVMRKLMTLDFVLARPEATFCATEEDKVSLLQELEIEPDWWPAKRYASPRVGGPTTTRYFVDKMPWYRKCAASLTCCVCLLALRIGRSTALSGQGYHRRTAH